MGDINNFPRVGNASLLDFDSSMIHIIFRNTPETWIHWRAWVNVWGFSGITSIDILVLVLSHLEALLFCVFVLLCTTIWYKWTGVLEIALLSARVSMDWIRWMIFALRLATWSSFRANIADFFKSKTQNSRPRQRATHGSPAKAPSSTQVANTHPGQQPTHGSPAKTLPFSSKIETPTVNEFFGRIVPASTSAQNVTPTKKSSKKTSHADQDEFRKGLISSVASIFVGLWKLVEKLLETLVFIFFSVLGWILSTIRAALVAGFKFFAVDHWLLSNLFVCFLVFTLFAMNSYINSNPNAARTSVAASFLEDFREDVFGNLKSHSWYLLSFIPWSVSWVLVWVWYYFLDGTVEFISRNLARFGNSLWGILAGVLNYASSFSSMSPSMWDWAVSWLPNNWDFLSNSWQYVLSFIISFGLPVGLVVLFAVLGIGCYFYSKRLLVWSLALFSLLATVWVYVEHEACVNSMAFTAFALVIIAFVAWATQKVVDFTKRICPHIWGLPFSVLTWQPIIWVAILLLGQYLKFFSISKFLQLYTSSPWLCVFLFLAIFKDLKIFVHTVSYYLWTRPVAAPHNPTITPADVTVIIPTVGEFGQEFTDTVESVLRNQPGRVIISTISALVLAAQRACQAIEGGQDIEVVCVEQADKCIQLLRAVQVVRSIITVYADDHVTWPETFLRSALAPFEDPVVGLVGTSKRVVRNRNLPPLDNFFNYIACIYLERHNFECTATNNIDGGVFVISGRTALARTSVLHSLEYRSEFQAEFFGAHVGPMKVDDDDFNTRFMIRHGYKTHFHNDEHATITTTLVSTPGQLTKFRGQLLRWTRTTWGSSIKSLLTDRACYQATPWTTYAIFIPSLVNFAILYDAAMFFALRWSGSGHMCSFIMLLLLSKLIKPLPHLRREPRDWQWVPFGILFGYFHSFIKLYSMLTMGNIDWSGRQEITAKRG